MHVLHASVFLSFQKSGGTSVSRCSSQSLLETTTSAERSKRIKILVGIDEGDRILDTEEGRAAVAQVFRDRLRFQIIRIAAIPMPPPFEGNVVPTAGSSTGRGGESSSALAMARSSPADGKFCKSRRGLEFRLSYFVCSIYLFGACIKASRGGQDRYIYSAMFLNNSDRPLLSTAAEHPYRRTKRYKLGVLIVFDCEVSVSFRWRFSSI